jgi:streptogramin lyase
VGRVRPGELDRSNRPDDQAEGRHLVRVDPVTGRDLAHIHFGKTLAHAATAPDGSIWMPDKEQNLVYRIDPERAAVIDSFGAGPGPSLRSGRTARCG